MFKKSFIISNQTFLKILIFLGFYIQEDLKELILF